MNSITQNKLFKVLSINAVSVGISFVLGVVSTKIISLFLGTPGMALMGSFRNFTMMLKSLATLGINNSIIKLFVENKDDKKELSVIYATFFWLFLLLSATLALPVLLFAESLSRFLFASDAYHLPVRIFALSLPLVVMNTFWIAIYNGLELFKKIVLIQIISNVLVFLITAIFIWNGAILGGLLSIAVAEVAMVLITYLFIKQNSEYFKFELKRVISKKYISIIGSFSAMALLTAVIAPLTLILIRNYIIDVHSIDAAGIWDGVNRLSGFYMIVFNSGLSLYYMPKLASLSNDSEFSIEVKSYFKTLVPLFASMLVLLYIIRKPVVDLAFTPEFAEIKNLLAWQLAGDFVRFMTLAFGFQIVVKTMLKEYFVIESAFNILYLLGAFYLVPKLSVEGALQAYFYANLVGLIMVLWVFRKFLRQTLFKNTRS